MDKFQNYLWILDVMGISVAVASTIFYSMCPNTPMLATPLGMRMKGYK